MITSCHEHYFFLLVTSSFPLEIFESIILCYWRQSVIFLHLVSQFTLMCKGTYIQLYHYQSRVWFERHRAAASLRFERLISQTPRIAYCIRTLDYNVTGQDLAEVGNVMVKVDRDSRNSRHTWTVIQTSRYDDFLMQLCTARRTDG